MSKAPRAVKDIRRSSQKDLKLLFRENPFFTTAIAVLLIYRFYKVMQPKPDEAMVANNEAKVEAPLRNDKPLVHYEQFFEHQGVLSDFYTGDTLFVPYYQPMQKRSVFRMGRIAELVKAEKRRPATFVEIGAGSAFGSYLLAREGHTAIAIDIDADYIAELAKINEFQELEDGRGIYVSLDSKTRMILIAGDVSESKKIISNLSSVLERVNDKPAFSMWQDFDSSEIDIVWDSFQPEGSNWSEVEESLDPSAIIHIHNKQTGSELSYGGTQSYMPSIFWRRIIKCSISLSFSSGIT